MLSLFSCIALTFQSPNGIFYLIKADHKSYWKQSETLLSKSNLGVVSIFNLFAKSSKKVLFIHVMFVLGYTCLNKKSRNTIFASSWSCFVCNSQSMKLPNLLGGWHERALQLQVIEVRKLGKCHNYLQIEPRRVKAMGFSLFNLLLWVRQYVMKLKW